MRVHISRGYPRAHDFIDNISHLREIADCLTINDEVLHAAAMNLEGGLSVHVVLPHHGICFNEASIYWRKLFRRKLKAFRIKTQSIRQGTSSLDPYIRMWSVDHLGFKGKLLQVSGEDL